MSVKLANTHHRFFRLLPALAIAFLPLVASASTNDPALTARFKGSILLQVQQHGEAWYVRPKDSQRYYMADGSAAYGMMRSFGLGIADTDLAKIPSVADTNAMKASASACASNAAARRMKGEILLQVQQHGEAWYIDPDKCRAIYLKDGAAAYSIMRFLGRGIADTDITKIATGADVSYIPAPPPEMKADVHVDSLSCALTTVVNSWGNTYPIRAIVKGTAQGPVGTRLELPLLIWSDDKWDCGAWTYGAGALIAVGGTCRREAGAPTSTTWSVDTGGEETGEQMKGKNLSYTANIYSDGDLQAQASSSHATTCQ